MPFVRIDTPPGLGQQRREHISASVYEAMVATLGVPPDDLFQIFSSDASTRVYSRNFLGISRSDATIFIDVRLRRGRRDAQKREFYAQTVKLLVERIGIAPADVFITLSENDAPDWSFGNGIAQFASG